AAVKAILPYRHAANLNWATVQPTVGGVLVYPFRAVIGTRVDDVSSDVQLWQDIRSAVFTSGVPADAAFSIGLPIGPVSPTDYPFDLIYAVITPDALGPSVTRNV